MEQTSEVLKNVQQVLNEIWEKEVGVTRGFYIYYFGTVGKYKVGYTKVRAMFNNKRGFFSWIQRTYNNGKTRRMRIAKSGSGKKAHLRAERLYNQLKEQEKYNGIS